jgi:16S rRNA (cytosine967-C5)-methyltransferase
MQKTTPKKPSTTLVTRQVALAVLLRLFTERTPLQEALEVREFQCLSADNRAFVRMLVTTTVRYYGALNAILSAHLAKPLPKKTEVAHFILLLGIAEGIFLKTPDYAVASNTVELLKKKRFVGLAGLGNAIMRKILADAENIQQRYTTPENLLPAWLLTKLQQAYGIETTDKIVTAQLTIPPLDVTCFAAQDEWARRLNGELLNASTIRLQHADKIDVLPGFSEGAWQVQDVAASLPALLFGTDLTGKTVIDLCAAPGGKSVQIAKAGATVIAVESSEPRAKRLMENARRMGVFSKITVKWVDMLNWQPDALVDAVLLDAPCSATGTLRRHPDVAWHKQSSDIPVLQDLQKTMIAKAATFLKVGGILVYATCSLLPEEGEDVVEHFLSMNANFARVAPEPNEKAPYSAFLNSTGDLRTLPCYLPDKGGMDGFYAARLIRKS